MIRKFYHLLDYGLVILLIGMLLASPILCGKNTYTICLIYSHYLTVYMNNIFLLMTYQLAYRFNSLHAFMLLRIGEKKYYQMTYFSLILLGLLYTFMIYISYYFFFGAIEIQSLYITVIYMLLNIIVVCIENTIIYLQIGQKKNFLYLALPIFINFLFHILFSQLF